MKTNSLITTLCILLGINTYAAELTLYPTEEGYYATGTQVKLVNSETDGGAARLADTNNKPVYRFSIASIGISAAQITKVEFKFAAKYFPTNNRRSNDGQVNLFEVNDTWVFSSGTLSNIGIALAGPFNYLKIPTAYPTSGTPEEQNAWLADYQMPLVFDITDFLKDKLADSGTFSVSPTKTGNSDYVRLGGLFDVSSNPLIVPRIEITYSTATANANPSEVDFKAWMISENKIAVTGDAISYRLMSINGQKIEEINSNNRSINTFNTKLYPGTYIVQGVFNKHTNSIKVNVK